MALQRVGRSPDRTPGPALAILSLVVVGLLLLLSAANADATRLTREGLAAYEQMDLDLAQQRLTEAREQAAPAQRPKIELWLGIVELERGNDAAGKRWIRSALAGNPKLTPTDSMSPKVKELMEELRPKPKAARSAAVSRPTRPLPPLPAGVAPGPAASPAAAAAPSAAADAAPPVADAVASPSAAAAEPTAEPPVQAEPPPPMATAPVVENRPIVAPAPAQNGGVVLSPLLVIGVSAGAVAIAALVGGFAVGAIAKSTEGAAVGEKKAVDATERYKDASGEATIANVLYVASLVSALGAGGVLAAWVVVEQPSVLDGMFE